MNDADYLKSLTNAKSTDGDWQFITVESIRAVASGSDGFLSITLKNNSYRPDKLIDARIDPVLSRLVQMHIVTDEGMTPVPEIPVYPKATMRLPGTTPNYHIMLIGVLGKPPAKVNVTLHFELMGSLYIPDVPVS